MTIARVCKNEPKNWESLEAVFTQGKEMETFKKRS